MIRLTHIITAGTPNADVVTKSIYVGPEIPLVTTDQATAITLVSTVNGPMRVTETVEQVMMLIAAWANRRDMFPRLSERADVGVYAEIDEQGHVQMACMPASAGPVSGVTQQIETRQ